MLIILFINLQEVLTKHSNKSSILRKFVEQTLTRRIISPIQSYKTQNNTMILKMINDTQLSKDDRKKFIPFVNERDHMGSIIKVRNRERQNHKSMDVFENLRKTSKEYFFDKKYERMRQKFERCKFSLEQKEPNYDTRIKSCLKALQKNPNTRSKDVDWADFEEKSQFFVDLNEKLSENIMTLKGEIQQHKKTKTQIEYSSMQNSTAKTRIYNYPPKSLTVLTANHRSSQSLFHRKDGIRKKSLIKAKQKDYLNEKMPTSLINRQIFKEVGPQSQVMADFTNCGLKYRHLVKAEKKDPWKKWYVNSKIEIFPGESIKMKKLQKSIYD